MAGRLESKITRFGVANLGNIPVPWSAFVKYPG
jgi:hypothetical protein